MANQNYWLTLGPITPEERKTAKEYLTKHNLPVNKKSLQQRVAKMRKRRAVNRYLRGREEAATDPNTPWKIIYGDVVTGGAITFIHTSGPTGQKDLYLHLIITIAAHEINYIRKVYFNNTELSWDTTLTTRPTGVILAQGIFDGFVKMQINYGSDSQSALSVPVGDTSDAYNPVGAKWTMNHRQRGHAHVYFRLKWDPTIFKDGIPDITFLVSGKYDVVDPRTMTTAPGAANAAMILYDYMTNTRWGLGASSSEFNSTRLEQACDDCEDLISLAGGGTEYRYLINTHFGADQSPGSIIEEMVNAMSGRLPYIEGKFSPRVGKDRGSTVLTITADMILSDIDVVTKTPRIDSFNAVRGSFISNQNNYEESDFPAVTNSTYETQDGGTRIYEDLTFSMTTSASASQRLAKIELEANRQGILVEFTARMDAYQAEPGEWVAVTYDRFGWSAKTFEVIRSALVIEQDQTGNPYFAVRLTLQETAAGVYDWNTGNETTFDVAPDTNLPNPFSVSSPSGLTLASGTSHLYMRLDGTIFARLYVSWTASVDAFVTNGGRYDIQYKKSADANWLDATSVPGSSTNAYILDVHDGQSYDVRIRAVSAMGQTGSWVTATGHTVIGKTAAPSDPTNPVATLQEYGIRLSWDPVSDLDVKEYEIRLTTTPPYAFASTTAIAWRKSSPFYYEPKTAGTYRFFIRAVDTSVNYSGNTVYADVTVAVPSTPTVSATVDGDGFLLSWTASTGSFAIKQYEIRYGATFAGGTPVATVNALKFRVTGSWSGERVFWVAATDIIGNTGTAGSYSAVISSPTSVKNLTSREINGTTVIDWTPPSGGTMPIRRYAVYRGSVYSSATSMGTVDGSFMTIIEPNAGTYVYWVAAQDTAGNVGPETSTRVSVSQPNGYTLAYNQTLSTDNATVSYVAKMYDTLGVVGPVDTAETWADHFTNNSATTIQDLIDDGLVYWAEPGYSEVGSAVWEVDLGAELRSASIATTYSLDDLVGTAVVIPQLSWKQSESDEWTRGEPGAATVSGTNYRFVRARFEVGGDILESQDATLTLAGTAAESTSVFLPIASETWAEHFINNGYTTIQNLIDAGYTYWLQPSVSGSDGTAEWVTDCGQVITSIDVALKFDVTQLDATDEVALSYEVATRRNETDSWTTVVARTSLSAGSGIKTGTATLTDFRYIKTTLYGQRDVSAPNALAEVTSSIRIGSPDSLMTVRDITLKIGVVTRTDSGASYAYAVDTSGTFIPFNLDFVDVESVVVSPDGTQELKAVPSFDDSPNPTGFYVYLFNASGTRVNGTVRWNATGVIES